VGRRLILLVILLILFISFIPISNVSAAGANWYDPAWNNRVLVTLNSSMTNQTLGGYPVMVKLTDNLTFYNDFNTSWAEDLTFVDYYDNTTTFPHEIELFNQTASGINLIAWVNVSQVFNNTDTKFWMYYNNTACPSQENILGTWDEHFIDVYHMDNNSLDTNCNDSTSTSTLTKYGIITPNASTGVVGYGQTCDNRTMHKSYLKANMVPKMATIEYNLTVECWVNFNSIPSALNPVYGYGLVNKYDVAVGTPGPGFNNYLEETKDATHPQNFEVVARYQSTKAIWTNGTLINISYNVTSWAGGTEPSNEMKVVPNVWYYHCETINESQGIIGNGAANLLVGVYHENGGAVVTNRIANATFDEVRISNINRNESYMNTTYNNIWNYDDFITLGGEQGKNSAPVISSPDPQHNEPGVLKGQNLSVTISDNDSDTMIWTIETNGPVGSNGINTNTTIYCNITGYKWNCNTTYIWWVNITDSVNTTRAIYWFNTTTNCTNNIRITGIKETSNIESTGATTFTIVGTILIISTILLIVGLTAKYKGVW